MPLFTLPLKNIDHVKPLYQLSTETILFEIVLNKEYEDLHILNKVEQHLQQNTPGGRGFSPMRQSKVDLKHQLKRAIPGSRITKSGVLVSPGRRVQLTP